MLSSDSGRPTKPGTVFVSKAHGARYWFEFGLSVIPLASGKKVPMVKWDPWLDGLTIQKISTYYAEQPHCDVGAIVGDGLVVMDADSPVSNTALRRIEQEHECVSRLVIATSKGEHRYYRVEEGAFVKSDAHSTAEHPERIDVKASRSMVVLPPSTGKKVADKQVPHVRDLSVASQAFIDAIFVHNGRPVPRPTIAPNSQRTSSIPQPSSQTMGVMEALLREIDPDCGHDDWFRVLVSLHTETAGSEEGLQLANKWSSGGKKY